MARRRRTGGTQFPGASAVRQSDAQMFAGKLPVMQQDVESKPSPAPIKGWDAISPLSNMEPDYAVILDNAVPRPNWVELRGGSSVWAQGLGGEVESLMVYRPAGDAEKLFAASEGTIYDASSYASPAVSLSGLLNNRWQYTNITPAGNVTYLVAVNGIDNAKTYNGTVWDNLNVTGVTTANLINVNAHKRRLWFIEKNTTYAWYLATDAIAGAATKFDMGSLMPKGGYLVAMGTWTVDGGNGPDDLAVFITSRGEIVVFKGTNPDSSNSWFHVGTFIVAPPIGRRCLTQFGSDLLIITQEGLIPISKSLPFDPSGIRSVALTNRIQNAMLLAAQIGVNLFGWETTIFPLQSLLIMNVPVVESTEQVQFVMNTLNGAWCRFTGWNANCFAIFNDSLFFGGNSGQVMLGYTGTSDVAYAIGMNIKTAFNYYDDPGRQKMLQMVRPYIITDGGVQPTFGANVDFEDIDFNVELSPYQTASSMWDGTTTLWDSSTWFAGAAGDLSNNWNTLGALGTAIALRIKANVIGSGISEEGGSLFDSGVFDTAVFDVGGVYTASGQSLPIVRINSFQVLLEQGAPVG